MPRFDVMVAAAGLLVAVAALILDPVVVIGLVLAYAVFAAAAVHFVRIPLSLFIGAMVLASGALAIVRLGAFHPLAVVGLVILVVGNGLGGLLHLTTGRLLRSQAARLEALFELSPDGIAVVDGQGRVLAVNDRFVELFGLGSKEEVVGTSIERCIPEPARREHGKLLRDFYDFEEGPRPMGRRPVLEALRADGQVIPVGITIGKIRFDRRRLLVAVVRDMTEHVENLRRMEEMAEGRLRLIASVSHEVRTPLTSVLGFAEMLRSPELSQEERQEALEHIASSAAEMAHVVEDLLVGARAELGELKLAAVAVDLRAQVNQVLETLRVSFPVEETPAGVRARGDPARVRQILRNLLTNAQRYGGSDVRIHITQAGGRAVLAVSDDGPPLTEEQRKRIFEPFYTAHPQRTRTEPVGLGLYLSRELARKMGGDLTYRHTAGRAYFELTLPSSSTPPPDLA